VLAVVTVVMPVVVPAMMAPMMIGPAVMNLAPIRVGMRVMDHWRGTM
jgi:hypothetical protein